MSFRRFLLGIHMLVVVPKEHCERVVTIIDKYHKCYIIGKIEKDNEFLFKCLASTNTIPPSANWSKINFYASINPSIQLIQPLIVEERRTYVLMLSTL